MSSGRFFLQLVTVVLGTGWLLYMFGRMEKFRPYSDFSLICLLFFSIISILTFYFGKLATKSSNKNQFTTVALSFSMAKIFLSVLVISIYSYLTKPETTSFVLSFIVSYVTFTIFETYVMMELGKAKA